MESKQKINRIREVYKEYLQDNIACLILGGSLARGNFVPGWSDIDMLLVLRTVSTEALIKVAQVEKKLKFELGTDIDTMVLNLELYLIVGSEKIHEKIKNFFFYIEDCEILETHIQIPNFEWKDFVDSFMYTCIEQEKKFYRRNIDTDLESFDDVKKTLKKNIKITFLVIKQFLVCQKKIKIKEYAQAARYFKEYSDSEILDTLNKYVSLRKSNAFETEYSNTGISGIIQVNKDIKKSVNTFRKVLNIVTYEFKKRN